MENKIEIVVGTSNPHKVFEMNEIAKEFNIYFKSLNADNFDPVENGKTFEENAEIKAMEAAKVSYSGNYFLADDSGLCVDFLNGAPGIYSARYESTPEKRIQKLLSVMKDVQNRNAHFTCALCLVDKNLNVIHKEEGKIYGEISKKPDGINGFGYDPIFFIPKLNKTMAELDTFEKNTLSHRGQALKQMLKWIQENL